MTAPRLYKVVVQRPVETAFELVAASDAAARTAALRVMPRGCAVVSCREVETRPGPEAAEDALFRILQAPFLPIDGDAAQVLDWLHLARADLARANTGLARAGLRVSADTSGPWALSVGSAGTVPFLAALFDGTPMAGTGLAEALRSLFGARPVNLTFAGLSTRATRLPWAVVQPMLDEAGMAPPEGDGIETGDAA